MRAGGLPKGDDVDDDRGCIERCEEEDEEEEEDDNEDKHEDDETVQLRIKWSSVDGVTASDAPRRVRNSSSFISDPRCEDSIFFPSATDTNCSPICEPTSPLSGSAS